MKSSFSLKHFVLDMWLLEQLLKVPEPGLTLTELQERWQNYPHHEGTLSRSTLTRHRDIISQIFHVEINSPDKKHYHIENPEELALDSLANDLLASINEYLFLDRYRSLGALIQPAQILDGMMYLHPIGDALEGKFKLKVRYQKFSDVEPYVATLHPYCLKADKGRWYLLAHKEGSERPAQIFALDRMQHLEVLEETYVPNRSINATTYFKDSFGTWVDLVHFPVQKVWVGCTERVAHYLRTLPLHASQKEVKRIPFEKLPAYTVYFRFNISPTPDFMAELSKWGKQLKVLNKDSLVMLPEE